MNRETEHGGQPPRRIFLAGASGAIGRPLTTMLVSAGHSVTGTTRSPDSARHIAQLGATPAIVDVLDPAALVAAVMAARPEVVIHQLTDLALRPGEVLDDERLTRNSLLRQEGTRNLVAASVAAGARRLIAQSIAWLYLPGPEPHTEDEPIVPAGPAEMSLHRQAVVELERMVTADSRFDGIVLRYGRLYGPGTWSTTPPEPPSVHVEAAARAAALAVTHGAPGIYHVADEGGPISTEKARAELGWSPADRLAPGG